MLAAARRQLFAQCREAPSLRGFAPPPPPSPGPARRASRALCFGRMDPSVLAWRQETNNGDAPSKRWGHSACSYRGSVLYFGGFDTRTCAKEGGSRRFSASCRSHRLAARQGTCKMCTGRTRVSCAVALRQRTAAGRLTSRPAHCACPLPGTRIWQKLQTAGTPPAPRSNHAAVMVGRYMLIIGGGSSGVKFQDVHVLDCGAHLCLPLCATAMAACPLLTAGCSVHHCRHTGVAGLGGGRRRALAARVPRLRQDWCALLGHRVLHLVAHANALRAHGRR